MAVVDLDRIDSWPETIRQHLVANEAELRSERIADHEYILSDTMHRLLNESPEMQVWDWTKDFIAGVMSEHDIRVFHATRLLDADAIRREGLQRLSFETVIPRVKAALSPRLAAELDERLTAMVEDDGYFAHRQGSVWLTPQRRFLHDGGCDIFFEHFGGEAVQRLAGEEGELVEALQALGKPQVVVARIPATGWCRFADGRLPQSMIELFLERQGDWDPMDYGWDVMLERDIPADRIEAIVDPRDPAVAG